MVNVLSKDFQDYGPVPLYSLSQSEIDTKLYASEFLSNDQVTFYCQVIIFANNKIPKKFEIENMVNEMSEL